MRKRKFIHCFLGLLVLISLVSCQEKSSKKSLNEQIVFDDFVGFRHYSDQYSNLAVKFENKSGKTVTGFRGYFTYFNDFNEEIGNEDFEINSNFSLCSFDEGEAIKRKLAIPSDTKFLIDIGDQNFVCHYYVVDDLSIDAALNGKTGWYYPITGVELGIKSKYTITGITFDDGTFVK